LNDKIIKKILIKKPTKAKTKTTIKIMSIKFERKTPKEDEIWKKKEIKIIPNKINSN